MKGIGSVGLVNKTYRLLLIGVSVLALAGAGVVTGKTGRTGIAEHLPLGEYTSHEVHESNYKAEHHNRTQQEELAFQSKLFHAESYVETATEGRTARIDESRFADISIRLPDRAYSHLDREILQHAREELLPRLNQSISSDNLYIINMARDIGSEILYAEKVPQAIRTRSEDLSHFFNKKPSPLAPLPNLLFNALPPGAMVVIVSHVNATEKTLVSDDATFSITDLSYLARKKQLNLLILGCKSAYTTDIGTTHFIDSLVVMKQLGTYLSKSAGEKRIIIGDLYSQAAKASGGLLLSSFAYKVFLESDAVNKHGDIERTDYLSLEPVQPRIHPTSFSPGEVSVPESPDFKLPWLGTLAVRFTFLALAVSAMWGVLHNLAYKTPSDAGLGLTGHFFLFFPVIAFHVGFEKGDVGFIIPSLLIIIGCLAGVFFWEKMTWLGRFRAIGVSGVGLFYFATLMR